MSLYFGSQNISSYRFGLKNFDDYFSSQIFYISPETVPVVNLVFAVKVLNEYFQAFE